MGTPNMNQSKKQYLPDTINETIREALTPYIQKQEITCANAHRVGSGLNVDPIKIGKQLDILGCKIIECQLGLFGYGRDKKKLNPGITVPDGLDRQIDAVQDNGTISCAQCWDMAKRLKISRLDMGSVCEKKKVRIKPCQLGAF